MRWSEPVIASALARQTFQRKYLCVVPNCLWTGHECDLLVVTEKLRLIDVEIKISRADLKADADKDKWWRTHGFGRYEIVDGEQKYVAPPRTPKPWPHRVWKHYYAMPAEIWKPELIDALPSKESGVILLRELPPPNMPVRAVVTRRAKPCSEAKPISVEEAIGIARLASLRMWDALLEKERVTKDYRQAFAEMKVAA